MRLAAWLTAVAAFLTLGAVSTAGPASAARDLAIPCALLALAACFYITVADHMENR